MEPVTIKRLRQFDSVYNAIAWAQNQIEPTPKNPVKPRMTTQQPSLGEVQIYSGLLEIYDKAYAEYSKELADVKERTLNIYCTLVDYIREESGLNNIPEQYRSKVYNKAYSDGHAEGYYSVYQHLCNLVEIFE
jgi:hypothetical protein